MCIYVHEFASALGISDGNLYASRRQGDPEKAVYPIRGIHDIGYVDIPEQQITVYFDLTAKAYVFTDGSIGSVEDAVMQGIIIVEQIGKTDAVESLYQVGWKKKPFNPEQSTKVLKEGKEEFMK